MLEIAGMLIQVPDRFVDALRLRCVIEPFLCPRRGEAHLSLELVPTLEGAGLIPLGTGGIDLGQARVGHGVVTARVSESPFAAEFALRLLVQVGVVEMGGLLFHSSAVEWEGIAAVAPGVSGTGKSTFARLCVEGSPAAVLMSDEIVALFPNGRAYGTPFRSDFPGMGTGRACRTGALVFLRKGAEESVTPVAEDVALQRLLPNVYRPAFPPLSWPEVVRRALGIVRSARCGELTFRKVPEVADVAWRFARGD